MEGGLSALDNRFPLVFTRDPRITDLPSLHGRFSDQGTIFLFFSERTQGLALGDECFFFPFTLPTNVMGINEANVKRIWKSDWKSERSREKWDAPTGMIIHLAAHA